MTQSNEAQLTVDGIFRLIQSGQFGPAEEYCRKYLEKTPDDVNVLGLLGAILVKLDRPDDAKTFLEKAIQLEPQFAKPREDLGFLHLKKGELDAAIERFEEALRLDEEQPSAWSGLADALMRNGDQQSAHTARQRFLQLSPAGRTVAEARRTFKDGNSKRAQELCEAALKEDPNSSDALQLLASIATADERYVVAEGLLKRLVKLSANHYFGHSELARFLGDRGRFPEAIEEMQLATQLDPDVAECHQVLGDLHSVVGNTQSALAAYEAALAIEPDNSTALAGRGHALRILGRSAEAIEAYEQCTTVRPSMGDAWWSLATMRGYSFSPEQIATLEAQLESEEASPETRVHVAFALARAAESRDEHDAAWSFYLQGSRLKRDQFKYDPVSTEVAHDSIIETFNSDFLQRAAATDFDEPGPIFILGLPRSGSTLIEQILASHSMVEGGGELPYIVMLKSALGSAEDASLSYPKVLEDMNIDKIRALGESYLYHTKVHRSEKLPYFTDKMPANFSHVGLIHMALPNARIIDARRHPLDTCVGNFRQLFAQGKNMTYDLFELAEYYLEYDRVMTHWDDVLPGRVLRVVYEDVVADLEGQTRRMLDYCGLPFEEACLNFHRNTRPVNTASSEQVRQPIYADSIGYWKNFEAQLEEIKAVLAPILPKQ